MNLDLWFRLLGSKVLVLHLALNLLHINKGSRSDQKLQSGNSHDGHTHSHATKVAHLASEATIRAAIVEAGPLRIVLKLKFAITEKN